MATFKLNLKGAGEQRDFSPIPVGAYTVQVTDAEVRDSKSSANKYVNWELTVADGSFKNRKLWVIMSLSPKAAWKAFEVLEAFGEPKEKLDSEDFQLDISKYVGRRCTAEVDVETYELRQPDENGNTEGVRNTVTRLLKLNGAKGPSAQIK